MGREERAAEEAIRSILHLYGSMPKAEIVRRIEIAVRHEVVLLEHARWMVSVGAMETTVILNGTDVTVDVQEAIPHPWMHGGKWRRETT